MQAECSGLSAETCETLVDGRAMKTGVAGAFGNVSIMHDVSAEAQCGSEFSDEALHIDCGGSTRLSILAGPASLLPVIRISSGNWSGSRVTVAGRPRGIDRHHLTLGAQPCAGPGQRGDPVVDDAFGEGFEAGASRVMAADALQQVEHEVLLEVLPVHAGNGVLTVEFRCEITDAPDGARREARVTIESVQGSSPLSR